jgi:ABC-2 type transport system permease protein
MIELIFVLRAEIKRLVNDQVSNLWDSVSWLIYTGVMFIAIVAVLNGVTRGGIGTEEQLLILVGWLAFQVAGDGMDELPAFIMEESKTGTLEQICITPHSLGVVMFARSIAYFIISGLRGVTAAVFLILLVGTTTSDPSLLLLFVISAVGAYGLGFVFAGLALIFKQIESLASFVFSIMIFLTGAFVGLESFGWIYDVLRYVFPLTWGISLMRTVIQVGSMTPIVADGSLLGLTLHSIVYLFIGIVVFTWGFNRARHKGTLAHY